jgi:hypothetical protein
VAPAAMDCCELLSIEFQGRTPEFLYFRIRGCVPEIP